MKRILLHLAISILAFGLGITVSALWRFYTVNLPEPYISEEISSPVLSLKGVELGCRSHGSVYSYYLPNGNEITRTCQQFSSAAEANSMLQERRRGDFDIVEWSANLDSNGQRTGETVLLVSRTTALQLVTFDKTFCETRASSLDGLRWFEEDYENHHFH